MKVPSYANRHYFSATLSNRYSDVLLQYYGCAVMPHHPFERRSACYSDDNDGTEVTTWSGYLLYTGDTDAFRYSFRHTSSGGEPETRITIGGSMAASSASGGDRSGSVDITSLSLVDGTVYPVAVTLSRTGTAATVTAGQDIYWLGLARAASYTAPPAFVASAVLAPSDMEGIRTSLSQLDDAVVMPPIPFNWERKGRPGHRNGDDNDGNWVIVWRGSFYHAHNVLRYRVRRGSGHKNCDWKIEYNTGTETSPSWNTAACNSSAGFDATDSGSAELEGLTATNIYAAQVIMRRTGTAKTTNIFCHAEQVAEESAYSITPPPVWEHGASDVITACNLNKYSEIIDAIHPGASAPSAPLYYEQPAIRSTDSERYYIRHTNRWLRYRAASGGGTPEIYHGPNLGARYSLDSSSGNHSADLRQVPGLVRGQYYMVDDCDYAQEYTEEQP